MMHSAVPSITDQFGLFRSERTALLSKTRDFSFYLTLNLFEGYEIVRSDPVRYLCLSVQLATDPNMTKC